MNITPLSAEPAKEVSAEQLIKQEYDEFLYIVSHDLHAPLRHIREFTNILLQRLDGKLEGDEKKFGDFIQRSVSRTEAMLEGMLELSRLNTRAEAFCYVDCNDVVGYIQNLLNRVISSDNVTIHVDPLPVIHGEHAHLRQLFFQLIDNAIKFRRLGVAPEISISAVAEGKFWHFTVKDNGIGVDEGFEEKIFLLFKRLHPDVTYPGVGVGLTLCKKIVEEHGGKIWCERNTPYGSIFHFTLQSTK